MRSGGRNEKVGDKNRIFVLVASVLLPSECVAPLRKHEQSWGRTELVFRTEC